jgi:hypothetical protein
MMNDKKITSVHLGLIASFLILILTIIYIIILKS